MKLTEKQLLLLEDVFNYAINCIEEATKNCMLIVRKEDGTFENFNKEEKVKEIIELGEYIKPFIEIVDKEEKQ